jgi:L-threonylcarbamoyladenylate synthase
VRIVRADSEGERVAAEWLRGGGVAVVPTDTVYGLAARPTDADAVQAVYRMKGRPEGMHLPVLAASLSQVRELGVAFTPGAEALARRWWPGPLTLAFAFGPAPDRPGWLDGRAEVAVRIPDHDFLRAVLAEAGPLLVTSANPHGAPTPLRAEDVAAALAGSVGSVDSVGLIVDGGPLTEVPSTLVRVSGATPVLEREGAIGRAEVEAALAGGGVALAGGGVAGAAGGVAGAPAQ